jgi:hypothetical protein
MCAGQVTSAVVSFGIFTIFWPWGPEVSSAPANTYASNFVANGSISGSGNTINNPVNTPPTNVPGV